MYSLHLCACACTAVLALYHRAQLPPTMKHMCCWSGGAAGRGRDVPDRRRDVLLSPARITSTDCAPRSVSSLLSSVFQFPCPVTGLFSTCTMSPSRRTYAAASIPGRLSFRSPFGTPPASPVSNTLRTSPSACSTRTVVAPLLELPVALPLLSCQWPVSFPSPAASSPPHRSLPPRRPLL